MNNNISLKIVVAETSVIVRSGLAAVLKRIPNLNAHPIEVSSPEALQNFIHLHTPDIVIVNPTFGGWFDLPSFKTNHNGNSIKYIALVCSVIDNNALKEYDESIAICDDIEMITTKINRLLHTEEEDEKDSEQETLSQREKEIITCVVKGMTNNADNDSFSIPALMDYLKRAHAYFLDFNLPAMRRKLIEAIDCSRDNDVAYLILKFFDEYAKEVRRHMEYENKAVFTYVEQLLQGKPSDVYNIATFASKHNQIDTKLKELKNIIIKYYPEKENNNLLNAVLFDIFNCEQDLASHCQVEDYMFVPAVAQIEKRLKDEQ